MSQVTKIMGHVKDAKTGKSQGFALIDILQPCVIFNAPTIRQEYRDKVYTLETTDYKPDNKMNAYLKAGETEKLPIGVLYEEQRATYESQLPQLAKMPLAKQEVKVGEIKEFFKEFK